MDKMLNQTEINTDKLVSTLKGFNWFDYSVFFGMLGLSVLIGLYHGFQSKKVDTVDDYMLGGRHMPLAPIAMSLVASFVSGITLLGIPAETYMYGTQLYGITISVVISVIIHNIFYLPVLYNLQYNSVNEYLEKRFSKKVKVFGSFLYSLALLLYIPVVIYVPSLAFNQVTGMPIYILAPIICTTCIFYTAIGGLKGVVWADALQSVFTLISMLTVIVMGCQSAGGFFNVWETSARGERIELFNMDTDPFKRNTFWTVVFGSIPTWIGFMAVHPATVQRYIALPTLRHARMATLLMCLGILLVKTISTFTGLIIYTKYHDCDPVVTKVIRKLDQLLAYYVMDVAGAYYGLAGLFLSGVVSTALSTMSTSLNTLSGTIYEDFVKTILPGQLTDHQANVVMKLVVIVLGLVCTLNVFVVEKLGSIMQLAITLQGITSGVGLSLFTFGIFVPWGNSKGILAGAISGLCVTAWLVFGAQMAIRRGDLSFPGKLTSIDGCPANMTLPSGLNGTHFGYPGEGTVNLVHGDVPWMYQLSYLYYSDIGLFTSLIVASVVSLLTGGQDIAKLDPNLIIPQLRSFFPQMKKKKKPSVELYAMVSTTETILCNHQT